jgi:DNA-binding PadR family transcriptional regulator
MERFRERHQDHILGVLSGFDRLLFRGTLTSVSYLAGLEGFLATHSPLYKEFGAFVERLSQRIKDHAEAFAATQQRPFRYLAAASASKEDLAREIMEADRITQGLVCVFSCVEPCQSYTVQRDRQSKHIRVVPALRKCLHLYFYFVDREFGLMHVRLQTWLPFQIQVCVNGREYLARQMTKAGIDYEQRDNCFTRIDDLTRAQKILERLTTRKWGRFLNALARRVNPLAAEPTYGFDVHGYYWTLRQSEYATDVMFKDAAALKAIYPKLVAHAITQLTCEDVLRFLGRRTDRRFVGEVTSDVVKRIEGVRVKHRVEENSLKMYDKQGNVLRIETTINDPRRFKVRRVVTRKGQTGWHSVAMRKGLADIERRVDVCRAANERYLEALAVVGEAQPVATLLDPVSRRVQHDGRPYRALRPLTREETDLFRELLRGEFLLQGFRNPDLRRALLPEVERDPDRRRQASGRVTRLLRLLRAHGLIRKVPSTRYYRVTVKGQQLMTLALQLRETDLARLAA